LLQQSIFIIIHLYPFLNDLNEDENNKNIYTQISSIQNSDVPSSGHIKGKARRTFIIKKTHCTAVSSVQKQHIKRRMRVRGVFEHCVDYACKNETSVTGEDV
jgi:hypothetical protein